MMKIGLTGSIGMGKSTTAQFFRDFDIPVYDSDAAVHALYRGRAAELIEANFPGTTQNGVVDREKLAPFVLGNAENLKQLEAIVHPLVREEELKFVRTWEQAGASFVILDIPLLFETGGDTRVDKIIVVTAPAHIQRDRVLQRDGMSAQKFDAILAIQTPDEEKRKRADFIIDTSLGLDHAKGKVHNIIQALTVARGKTNGNA